MAVLEKLYQFNSYSYEKRADLLLEQGIYLRSRNRLNCDVHLFWMADGEYYGELWLKEGTTELHNIRSFIYKDALGWYPDLCRMSEEDLNTLKATKFPDLEGLTFEK